MSLIPTPDTTQQEIIKNEATYLARHINNTGDQLKENIRRGWEMFWNNSNATPQQILDALGSNAHKVFEESAFWQGAVKTRSPEFVKMPPKQKPTFNQDGTVTLTDWLDEELLALYNAGQLTDAQLVTIGRADLIPQPEPEPVVEPTPE